MAHFDHSLVAQLIQQYGYWAVLIGSVLEGETILVIAGFAAHSGYLALGTVVAVGTFGGFLGDQVFYWLGRARGRALLARWPALSAHTARVEALLRRYDAWIIVAVRFMYGLRVAGPVALGMSGVGALRFTLFNLAGALLWAGSIGVAGYLFGHALQLLLDDVRRYEGWILAGLAGLGAGIWIYHRLARRATRRS